MWRFLLYFFESFASTLSAGWSFIIQFFDLLEIFFFRERFIEKIKLFLAQPSAAETILAANTVIAKYTVSAIFDVLGKIAVVGMVEIDAFVAKFALVAVRYVGAIPRA